MQRHIIPRAAQPHMALPPPRPQSSASRVGRRESVQELFRENPERAQEGLAHVTMRLARQWRDEFLAFPDHRPVETNSIGCILPSGNTNHGYFRIKRRMTINGKRRNIQIYMHQLAMILKEENHPGSRDLLLRTGTALDEAERQAGDYELQCSHLCLTRECINPEHIVVETKAANLARNDCLGKQNINVYNDDGSIFLQYRPCQHVNMETEHECILENLSLSRHNQGVQAVILIE